MAGNANSKRITSTLYQALNISTPFATGALRSAGGSVGIHGKSDVDHCSARNDYLLGCAAPGRTPIRRISGGNFICARQESVRGEVAASVNLG